MRDITTEDYIFIEAIGLLIYYYDISEDKQNKYREFMLAAKQVATERSDTEITDLVLKELVSQDAIAFRLEYNDVIQPNSNIGYLFDTLLRYSGDNNVTVIANIDEEYIVLFNIKLSRLVNVFYT